MIPRSLTCVLAAHLLPAAVLANQPAASPEATPTPPPLTLQQQIDFAAPGSTVVIPPGDHVLDEPLRVDGRSDLTITAAKPRTVRLLVTDSDAPVVYIIGSSNIRLENLYMRHEIPEPEYICHGAVVEIEGSHGIVVRNSELNGSGAVGVRARQVTGLTIVHCYIYDNTWTAFQLTEVREALIKANVVQDNANMMHAYGVDDLTMADNVINGNGGYWSHHPWSREPGLKDE